MARLRHHLALTRSQREELLFGPELALLLEAELDRASYFPSAAARAEAWRRHREELIAEARARAPGLRPWAYWALEAGFAAAPAAREPSELAAIRHLARSGELSAAEAAELRRRAAAARARIGTAGERAGADRHAVALGAALEAGLRARGHGRRR